MDEGLIECGKAQEWFTDYFDSELVMVCKGGYTLGTPCKEDLDRAYYPFKQFYLNYHAKFLYSLFNTFILDSSPQTL